MNLSATPRLPTKAEWSERQDVGPGAEDEDDPDARGEWWRSRRIQAAAAVLVVVGVIVAVVAGSGGGSSGGSGLTEGRAYQAVRTWAESNVPPEYSGVYIGSCARVNKTDIACQYKWKDAKSVSEGYNGFVEGIWEAEAIETPTGAIEIHNKGKIEE